MSPKKITEFGILTILPKERNERILPAERSLKYTIMGLLKDGLTKIQKDLKKISFVPKGKC